MTTTSTFHLTSSPACTLVIKNSKGQSLELTLDEVRQVHTELGKLIQTTIPYPAPMYPVYPLNPWSPVVTWAVGKAMPEYDSRYQTVAASTNQTIASGMAQPRTVWQAPASTFLKEYSGSAAYVFPLTPDTEN